MHAGRNAAAKAPALDRQRECALHFLAGAHATRTDDAFGRIIGEIGIAVILGDVQRIGLATLSPGEMVVQTATLGRLIADIAQAHGARFQGRRLGTFGKAACLSFFPSKNLGGFGDGGAVVTDDEDLHRFVSALATCAGLPLMAVQYSSTRFGWPGSNAITCWSG